MNSIDLFQIPEQEVRNIQFDPEAHKYTDEYNTDYTSVTTLIDKYHPQFDSDYWAAVEANKRGITPAQVKAEWKGVTDWSLKRGNKRHNQIEDNIKAEVDNSFIKVHNLKYNPGHPVDLESFQNSPMAKDLPEIHGALTTMLTKGYRIHAEKFVYNAKYEIAGMIDCPLIHDNREFVIVDWKTNKHPMMFVSGYYHKDKSVLDNFNRPQRVGPWVRKPEYMFDPVSHLEDCNGIKYSLQVSLYAYLLEQWGLKCKGLVIAHIREGYPIKTVSGAHISVTPQWAGHEKIIKTDFHEVTYYKQEIHDMLEHHKATRLN